MTETKGTPLDGEQFVSLETFRKDGSGVKTPVWAAAMDGKLVMITDGESYKVKRLRKNPACRVAACDRRGRVHGPFHEATGRVVDDPAVDARARALLKQKYGMMYSLFGFFAWVSRRAARRVVLEVALKG